MSSGGASEEIPAAFGAIAIDLTADDDAPLSAAVDLTGSNKKHHSRHDSSSSSSTNSLSGINRKRRKRSRNDNEVVVLPDEEPAVLAYDDMKPAAATSTFDCSVCLETHVERFRGYQLSGCCHLFCRECLYNFIQSKLKEKAVTGIMCPFLKCKNIIQAPDIRACTLEVGDGVSWQTYQELSTESYLDSAVAAASASAAAATNPAAPAAARASSSTIISLRRCPTNHCNFTFEYQDRPDAQIGQLFSCPTCQKMYCLNCPVVQNGVGPAHNGDCLQVLEEVRQDEERRRKLEEWKIENANANLRFRELLEREAADGTTKPCPTCHTPITKNGGCDHMHCTNCGTTYNWSGGR